ncbi:MAG: hypothetical protein NUV65_06340 [Candidatus Roizmanbacteria bacterium]|nr:hypothetical protein [Candidatus Roizmanbacteria bacterium]
MSKGVEYTMQGVGCGGGPEVLCFSECARVVLSQDVSTEKGTLQVGTIAIWENTSPEQARRALTMADPGYMWALLFIKETSFRFFAPYNCIAIEG